MRQKIPERRQQKPKRIKHYHRAVHIDGEMWSYKVGRGGIKIKSPTGYGYDVDLSTFSGWSWDQLERAEWKGNGFQVTPQRVKDYVERQLCKSP